MSIVLSKPRTYATLHSVVTKNVLQGVIAQMEEEKIEIEGWILDERPLVTIFCFYQPETNQAFDIVINEAGNLVPYYSGEDDENGINSFPANTIKEAIEKYMIE
ncbi:hypothetical protein ABVF54_05690 [Enterococcus mundtii]|uniref:Uncharacterized protein n=1 Tax=Enterococcus mundtii TaxID=53346 RepID=A0AAI8R756_ENTMU|nr:hypothetical protein [Enterococcus mundtii]BBM13542.1 predicted protein [Enterococcus mundtii]